MSISKEEITEMFLSVFPDAEYTEPPRAGIPIPHYMSHGVVLQLLFADRGIEWKISTVADLGGFDRLVGSHNTTRLNTIKMFMKARKEPHHQQLPADLVLSLFDERSTLVSEFDPYGVRRKSYTHKSTGRIQFEVLDYSVWNGGGWYTPNTKWNLHLVGGGGSERILSNLFDGTFEDLKNKVDKMLLQIQMEEL